MNKIDSLRLRVLFNLPKNKMIIIRNEFLSITILHFNAIMRIIILSNSYFSKEG